MSNKYSKAFHFLILLSLLVWNLWFYLHRNESYAYNEFLSYNSLYYPADRPVLKYLNFLQGDSVRVQILQSREGKPVLNNFDLLLKEGTEQYTLQLSKESPEQTELILDYTSAKALKNSGSHKAALVELYYSSLPGGNFKTYALPDWQYEAPEQEKELKEAEKIISEKIAVLKNEPDLEKIRKIASFLLTALDSSRGRPIDAMDQLSAMHRFNYARSKRSKVWCGDFASILALFLKSQGINSRLVCTEGQLGDLKLGGHSMNEVFVKELHKWILVDLTSKAIYLKQGNRYLNVLDLYYLHQNEVSDVEVMSFNQDSLKTSDYKPFREFYSPYFNSGTRFIYYYKTQFNPGSFSFTQKWKRYFFSSPTFATYAGSVEPDNSKFYIKQFAFILLSVYLVYCFILVVLKWRSKQTS